MHALRSFNWQCLGLPKRLIGDDLVGVNLISTFPGVLLIESV